MHIKAVSELEKLSFKKNTTLPSDGSAPSMPEAFNTTNDSWFEISYYTSGKYNSLHLSLKEFADWINTNFGLLNKRIYDLEEKLKEDNNILSSNELPLEGNVAGYNYLITELDNKLTNKINDDNDALSSSTDKNGYNYKINELSTKLANDNDALSSTADMTKQGIWGYNKLITDLGKKLNDDNDALSSSTDKNGYNYKINELSTKLSNDNDDLSSATKESGYNYKIANIAANYLNKTTNSELTVTGPVSFSQQITGTITNALEATKAYWS